MSGDESELVPFISTLREECPRVRILVVGKSGVGKSALINAVFGVDATAVSHHKPGQHDINKPLTFPLNDHVIIHDSQGFEAGEDGNLAKITDFIERRSNETSPAERLHAIWVCAEIPFAGGRLFETGVERILKDYDGTVPIMVVFTKKDILRTKIEDKIERELVDRGEELNDEEFDERVNKGLREEIDRVCVEPLRALKPGYPSVATASKGNTKDRDTIKDLVDQALDMINVDKVWLEMAVAQRSSAEKKIEASVRIGRKRYWHGLVSDIFIGLSVKKLVDVLHKDIVEVWNMTDPQQCLSQPEFLALLSVAVEDVVPSRKNCYQWTEKVVNAAIEHPVAVPVTVPAVVAVLFAEWVYETYWKTQVGLYPLNNNIHSRVCRRDSLRYLITFIIDLTLTMDRLFYLSLYRGSGPISIELVNKALLSYKAAKAPVHASIQAWTGRWDTFSHMDAKAVVDKIHELILRYSVKPEVLEAGEIAADETWLPASALRTPTTDTTNTCDNDTPQTPCN